MSEHREEERKENGKEDKQKRATILPPKKYDFHEINERD